MNRYRKRMLKRIEIRQRLLAGEPVEQLVKLYPFMTPRKLSLRLPS